MRIGKTVKNTRYALISQIITIVISFLNRTIFIHYLNAEYLGLNGLFSNILSLLSLAELGVGSAITINMYKPIAQEDNQKVKQLMNFYKTAYTIIGIVVLGLGISLLPFLDFFIEERPDIPHLEWIYILYVLNSSASYFFSYKRSIIFVNQNNYIDSINTCEQSIVQTIVQNTVLILTRDYILYFIVQILIIILFNFIISKKADRIYPYLVHNRERLEKKERWKIIKDVSALMMHRIGYIVVCSTDNILISKYVGIKLVGIYSNYVMILSAVKGVLGQFITAMTASVGNLNAIEETDKKYDIYQKIFFANTWLVGFCAIAFYVLFNPFISLWIGDEFLLSNQIVLLICINFYICDTRGIRSITNVFKESMGLFWKDRFKALFEAAINIIASIYLLKKVGFEGILLGTLCSTVLADLWLEPLILYRDGFKKKVSSFWTMFLKYTIVLVLAGGLTNYIVGLFDFTPFINFILSMIVVTIVPNIIFIMVFHRTFEFQYFVGLGKQLVAKKITGKGCLD